MMKDLRFGTVYFYHLKESEYIGPALTEKLKGSFMQIDFADVSMWYQVEKEPHDYHWSIVDEAYKLCMSRDIEPIPCLAHHFCPPQWIDDGPFNEERVEVPEYASYGKEYETLTLAQKSFADFVTNFVLRYRDRTNHYVLSHEWNIEWMSYCKEQTVEYHRLLQNKIVSTLLAYKIIRRLDPKARFSYGLANLYKVDLATGNPVTSLYHLADESPFGLRFMIQKHVETGDQSYIDLLKTLNFFHLGYTDAARDDDSPMFIDGRAGDCLKDLYRGSMVIGEREYKYKEYIKEIVVNPTTVSGNWIPNKDVVYGEMEQAQLLERSIVSLLRARSEGIPVTEIATSLVDKNEDFSGFGAGRWLFCPEGLYRMVEKEDHLTREPTSWTPTFERKKAAGVFRKYASQLSRKESESSSTCHKC